MHMVIAAMCMAPEAHRESSGEEDHDDGGSVSRISLSTFVTNRWPPRDDSNSPPLVSMHAAQAQAQPK
ncbi:unnamed protein product [Soboliphyme baturini]|uniref:Secreted protein n=1 Tax=Soboliphyme baturini TaxID=241478 RepID=A0A183J6A8_9BILA|nr:unnamed protein product [Soboliphyme baturini]